MISNICTYFHFPSHFDWQWHYDFEFWTMHFDRWNHHFSLNCYYFHPNTGTHWKHFNVNDFGMSSSCFHRLLNIFKEWNDIWHFQTILFKHWIKIFFLEFDLSFQPKGKYVKRLPEHGGWCGSNIGKLQHWMVQLVCFYCQFLPKRRDRL